MVDFSKFKKSGFDVRVDGSAQIVRPDLVELGNHISIDMGVYLSTSATIGDYVHIAPHVCIIGGKDAKLVMADFTGISAGSKIICASDDFTEGHLCPFIPAKYKHIINKPVILNKYCCVGVNSVVMAGVVMAEGSVLGANSLLTQDTEPWTIYVGSPAKPMKRKRSSELVLKGAKELGYE